MSHSPLCPRRLVRAALLLPLACTAVAAAASEATESPDATICNRYCDGRDAALSPGDRQPVSTTIFSRKIVLHLDDADAMGWASIENGTAGDEVWLDRSFDNGRTWPGGSKLGDTTIPAGSQGWRTSMFNVDDWNNRGVGVLRACGKAVDRADIACTAWARVTWNAGDRRTAAATGLMGFYNQSTGLFDTTGWWNSANALTALIQNVKVTGMGSYTYAIANTYDRNINAAKGQFRNDYIDDTGWWGLAWVAAYDQTKDQRYLNTAKADADYMATFWDGTCGGGVWWSEAKNYKNAISNSLYLHLTAALHNRIPGDTLYLKRAKDEWAWFKATGMINGDNLVNDGINLNTCKNNGSQVWSYNQGVLVGALAEFYKATGDKSVKAMAKKIANASTTTPILHDANGILREPCESNGCGGDGPSFKGAHVRGLAALNGLLAKHPYSTYLKRQADSAYAKDRNAQDAYGLHFAGPLDSIDGARQHSALDLMNAAPLP